MIIMNLQIVFFVSLVFICSKIKSSPVDYDLDVMNYMRSFGYLPSSSQSFENILSPNEYTNAIANFQRFAGINVTGIMDETTHEWMVKPRCGNPDLTGKDAAKRRKRYSLQGNRWNKQSLTYKIIPNGFTPDLTQDQVNREIREAFKWWSDVTPLTFTQVFGSRGADIDIFFAERGHNDGNPFDGQGGTLAHAFFPGNGIGGDAHFDDSETWTVNAGRRGVNLKLVAAHEFGHSLGLEHSDVSQALMAPFYNPRIKELHRDDILAIQRLYGPSTEKPEALPTSRTTTTRRTLTTTTRSTTTRSPNRGACNGRFDAITQIKNGSTYAFVGDMFWRINSQGVDPGFPKATKDIWVGFEGSVDAALSFGDTVDIFQGELVYRFVNGVPQPNFPYQISRIYQGIPNNIDAAFRWSGNNKIYFMKGRDYWRYNPNQRRVDPNYPRDITVWSGLPLQIDAALQWYGRTYFFSDTVYYRFNDTSISVANLEERPYPRRTDEWWLGCIDSTIGQLQYGGNGVGVISPSYLLFFVSLASVLICSLLRN